METLPAPTLAAGQVYVTDGKRVAEIVGGKRIDDESKPFWQLLDIEADPDAEQDDPRTAGYWITIRPEDLGTTEGKWRPVFPNGNV